MKQFLMNLKPIKYITLKQKYNKLENDYNTLKDAIEEKCFEVIYSQINVPEQIQQRDKQIKKLKKQIESLKETIRLLDK